MSDMTSTDGTWDEKLKKYEVYGRESDPLLYVQVTADDERYTNYKHACHAMLFAKTSKIALGRYQRKAIVLMQLRFDGYLGFPGGMANDGESPEIATTREIVEEIGWDSSRFGVITSENHIFSHVDEEKKLVLHFYTKELSEEQIKEVEELCLQADDHYDESLGTVIVPLYTMGDSYRGFPAFLKNNFIGNAKMQLTESLIQLNILTRAQVEQALAAKPARCPKRS